MSVKNSVKHTSAKGVSTESALLRAAQSLLMAMKRFNARDGLGNYRKEGMAIVGYNLALDQISLCQEMQILRAEVRLAEEKQQTRRRGSDALQGPNHG
jgi:hypothetical protein